MSKRKINKRIKSLILQINSLSLDLKYIDSTIAYLNVELKRVSKLEINSDNGLVIQENLITSKLERLDSEKDYVSMKLDLAKEELEELKTLI